VKNFFVLLTFLVVFVRQSFAQISPPGEGKARTADWFALGIRQKLDTTEGRGWQSMSYIGLGRKSNPDNYNPFFKHEIFVMNQEFYHQLPNAWQYSFALSYRRQDEYSDRPPYEHEYPGLIQEFRLYGRLSYTFYHSRFKLTPTFRQEVRNFYTVNFENTDEIVQMRSRVRLQLTAGLDRDNIHRLMASSEQLFAVSKEQAPAHWTAFNYRESRFSLYYSYSPKTITFSVGYMNNLVGAKKPYDVHYIALDIVIENPF
jgi:hypothetical protein